MSRRILRLGLLTGAAAQQRSAPPDFQKASSVVTPYDKFFVSEHDILMAIQRPPLDVVKIDVLADDEILELCRGQQGKAFVNLLLSRS